jgi:hypothetical protein
MEDDFAAWKRQLWPALRSHAFGEEAGAAVTYSMELGSGQKLTFEFPVPSVPQFGAVISDWSARDQATVEPQPKSASLNALIDGKPWVRARVACIRELHSKRSPRSCMHVSRAFPSCNRSILTEIYLCHACSYQEIGDGNARTGGARPLRGGGAPRRPRAHAVRGGGSRGAGAGERPRRGRRLEVCRPVSICATIIYDRPQR